MSCSLIVTSKYWIKGFCIILGICIDKSIYIAVHFTIVTRKNLESKQVKEKSIEEYLELAKAAVKKLDKYIKDFRNSYEQQFDPEQGNVEEEEHLEAVKT